MWKVDAGPTLIRLRIQTCAGLHVVTDIGDGNPDPKPPTFFNTSNRIIKVTSIGTIDGHLHCVSKIPSSIFTRLIRLRETFNFVQHCLRKLGRQSLTYDSNGQLHLGVLWVSQDLFNFTDRHSAGRLLLCDSHPHSQASDITGIRWILKHNRATAEHGNRDEVATPHTFNHTD